VAEVVYNPATTYEVTSMTPYQAFLVAAIRRGLDDVAGIIQFFPPAAIERELRPGQWTIRQHLAHMRTVEQRYLERLEGVLATGAYVPAPAPTDAPGTDEPIKDILEGFLAAGRRSHDLFNGLSDAQWNVRFVHPTIWGEVSVEWWAERFNQHVAEHLDEFWMYRQLAGLSPEAYARVTAGS